MLWSQQLVLTIVVACLFMQGLDLDQIVSEHYEKGSSQQSTQIANQVKTATPPSVQSKVRGASETPWKPESSETAPQVLCRHGVEVCTAVSL